MTNKFVKEDFKAKEVLDYLKCSDAEKREYENFKESLHDQASMYESTYVVGHMDGEKKGIEKGITQGIEQGIEQGKLLEKQEMAKTMLAEGFDVEMIVKITGLTEEIILR
jgi:predicted transposase/invertase (TIGR01784 family)